jgi:type IV pilus assembly protein PilE
MRRESGFTLIEIMIVVAIIAILMAIAIPQYRGYTLKAKVAEAFSTLADSKLRMEQYFQDNRRYDDGTGGTNCGITITDTTNFSYSCVAQPASAAVNPDTFVITATNKTSLAAVGKFTFNISDADLRKTVNFDGTTVNLQCWISSATSTC